ncbi:MAG: glutamate--cysteine ligase [Gammaproteobacteria bacterium]|nr:glutamate--cysteine ligase [Gammaproteobacteria bacterium]
MVYQSLKTHLDQIIESGQASCLSESLIGLEKESLRVAEDGAISQTAHPPGLGSALTNPTITTDFSEALLELITPPCSSAKQALAYLDDIQKYVYSKLDNEIMWATSMPCVVRGETDIPIAQYGSSNIGTMKTVYRRGLGYRYGRTMQVIAGIHFNYSVSDSFWDMYQSLLGDTGSRQDFIANQYMGLVRNMLRYGWMIPYLFGASPAVCKSFLHGEPTILSDFNEGTFYEPYATSLRMGDIGYTNSQEDMAGIKANYSSIDDYVSSLRCAITKPYAPYEEIGVKVDGEYRQLNANILQIENEYYSTIRPKQITLKNEKPTTALHRRGVAYIEVRSIDVNAFDPLGISEEQLYFLETLVLFCLLQDSPVLDDMAMTEVDMNLLQVAHYGRKPGLQLSRNDQPILLKDWALELLEAMQAVASLLDEVKRCDSYSKSLATQLECVNDPSKTPSARMLAAMRKNNEGFFHFAQRQSIQYYDYFTSRALSAEQKEFFEKMSAESIAMQKEIEQADTLSFDEFLQQYFAKD